MSCPCGCGGTTLEEIVWEEEAGQQAALLNLDTAKELDDLKNRMGALDERRNQGSMAQ